MGLDQFLYRTVGEGVWDERQAQTCDGLDIPLVRGGTRETRDKVGYWRKFNALHAYIVDQFAGGVDECQPIELSADDVQQIIGALEEALADPKGEGNPLQPRSGFFFGSTEIDEYYLAECREALTTFRWVAERMAEREAWEQRPGNGMAWQTFTYEASW
jgi:hypothetical protein